MKINKRLLIKTGTGMAAGFLTGGWYGMAAGGIAAGTTGGKAKPLKSALIGAGAGYAAGYAAQSLGLRGSGNIGFGSYTYRPLSARTYDYFNKPAASPSVSSSPSGSYLSGYNQYPNSPMSAPAPFDGVAAMLAAGANGGGYGQDVGAYTPYDAAGNYVPTDSGQGMDWIPVAILGAAVFLVGGV